jgi:hypothetical protein
MAGSTNFLQWNPNGVNQETDTQYAADAMRSGGATDPSVFASVLANKLFYQLTTFVAALATALANKGFTVNDTSLAQLESVLANIITTADLKPTVMDVPFSSTPTFDASKANGFLMTLSGNVTSSSVINLSPRQVITFAIAQNGIGGYGFAFPSSAKSPGTVDPTSNAFSIQQFLADDSLNLHPITPMMVS